MNFRQFLRGHLGDYGILGDLAADVLRDEKLAHVKLTPDVVRARLTDAGASSEAHKALDLAVELWSADWSRCPVCLCGWGRSLRRPGEMCGNLAQQNRPCVGLLMPQSMFDRVEWVYPTDYGAPDPRRKAVRR